MTTARLRSFLVVPFLLAFVGCSQVGGVKTDTQESIARQSLKTISECADVLETITDKPSAERARLRIEKLQKDLADQKRRSDELGTASHEEAVKLSQKLAPESVPVMARLERATRRVMSIPGAAEFGLGLGPEPPAK